jgi:hypothetical protein
MLLSENSEEAFFWTGSVNEDSRIRGVEDSSEKE